MEGLLDEFDPLSVKDPLSSAKPGLAPSPLPRSQPVSHSVSQSNTGRTSHHPGPLFSTDLPPSHRQSPAVGSHPSSVGFASPSGSGVGKNVKILARSGSLKVDDDDPLGLMSQSDLSTGSSDESNMRNRRTDGLLVEAQRRTQLRQQALANHLAHEPFRAVSEEGVNTTANSSPASGRATPLITLANLDREFVSCLSNDPPLTSTTPMSPSGIKIPTELFQNHARKVRADSMNSSPARSKPKSRFEPPMITTEIDQQKLAAALDEDFDEFVTARTKEHESNKNKDENETRLNRNLTSPVSQTRELELLKTLGGQSSPGLAIGSGRSTPSIFDGPEGRPNPIQLRGISSDSQSVMDDELAEAIRLHLPPRLKIPSNWDLIYSLDQHGTSLSTLYKQSSESMSNQSTVNGCVLVILDSNGNRFGAFVNEPFRISKEYYGSGECFLWKGVGFEPGDFRIGITVKAYMWTGINDYMILSDNDLLSVGGGDGKFGLWIDSNLEKGASTKCPAFNNDILCQSQTLNKDDRKSNELKIHDVSQSFDIIGLECWKISV